MPKAAAQNSRQDHPLAICIALAAMCFVVFGQTLGHKFIDFDDTDYVYKNPVVTHGLTWRGLGWAFGFHASNWHPLTWISHMLDCQLFGLNPAGHHLTSVLLHAATSVALFLALREMTGRTWPGAFVAALFAIHPLRVESVAWIAERKDVLSALFFVLTVWAYVRWVRNDTQDGGIRYVLMLFLFALGLMAKPMLVTLPVVLLLLDFWPLRLKDSLSTRIVVKIPLFVLSAASCVLTTMAQRAAIQVNQTVSLPLRLENAVSACAIYIYQMVFPHNLAASYPFPTHGVPVGELVVDSAILAAVSGLAIWLRKKQPWLLVGWLWYLVMLLPVIGFIQVGSQAHADRYTYLPQIGLYIALAWTVAEWRLPRPVVAGLIVATLGSLMVCACIQTRYWRDSETLWSHTIACTTNNDIAQFALANALLDDGDADGAIEHFQESLRINPHRALVHYNLGSTLYQQSRLNEAIREFGQALQINPHYEEAHNNLATALLHTGQIDEAISHFRTAVELRPGSAKAQLNLGIALLRKGELDEAIRQFQTALQLDPNSEPARHNLDFALASKNKLQQ